MFSRLSFAAIFSLVPAIGISAPVFSSPEAEYLYSRMTDLAHFKASGEITWTRTFKDYGNPEVFSITARQQAEQDLKQKNPGLVLLEEDIRRTAERIEVNIAASYPQQETWHGRAALQDGVYLESSKSEDGRHAIMSSWDNQKSTAYLVTKPPSDASPPLGGSDIAVQTGRALIEHNEASITNTFSPFRILAAHVSHFLHIDQVRLLPDLNGQPCIELSEDGRENPLARIVFSRENSLPTMISIFYSDTSIKHEISIEWKHVEEVWVPSVIIEKNWNESEHLVQEIRSDTLKATSKKIPFHLKIF